jgi:hypothetical protein
MITSEITVSGDMVRVVAPPKLEPLPDSRARELKGLVFSKDWGCWAQPIYCANCGAPRGYVPEDMTFAFALCDSPCWEQFGHKTEFMAIPDAIARKAFLEEKLAEANNRRQ